MSWTDKAGNKWEQCHCGEYYCETAIGHVCKQPRSPILREWSEANKKQQDLNLPPGVTP